MSTGNALAMRLKLKHLGVQHRVASQGEKLPLFDPTSHDMVLEGYCATDDLDHDRTKLRKYAFGYPLLFRQGLPLPLTPSSPLSFSSPSLPPISSLPIRKHFILHLPSRLPKVSIVIRSVTKSLWLTEITTDSQRPRLLGRGACAPAVCRAAPRDDKWCRIRHRSRG